MNEPGPSAPLRTQYQDMIIQITLSVPAVSSNVGKQSQAQGLTRAIEHMVQGLHKSWGFRLARIMMRRFPIGEQPHDDTTLCLPEEWRCGRCGEGQLMSETQGMFTGRRWIHTCGVTAAEHREEAKG